MLYLRKNEKNIEVNKAAGNEKLPYFSLFIAPEKETQDKTWIEVGAFWKSRSGKGYTGNFSKGFEFDSSSIVPYKRSDKGQSNGD